MKRVVDIRWKPNTRTLAALVKKAFSFCRFVSRRFHKFCLRLRLASVVCGDSWQDLWTCRLAIEQAPSGLSRTMKQVRCVWMKHVRNIDVSCIWKGTWSVSVHLRWCRLVVCIRRYCCASLLKRVLADAGTFKILPYLEIKSFKYAPTIWIIPFVCEYICPDGSTKALALHCHTACLNYGAIFRPVAFMPLSTMYAFCLVRSHLVGDLLSNECDELTQTLNGWLLAQTVRAVLKLRYLVNISACVRHSVWIGSVVIASFKGLESWHVNA